MRRGMEWGAGGALGSRGERDSVTKPRHMPAGGSVRLGAGLVPCAKVEGGTVLQPHFLSYLASHFPTPSLVSWTVFACTCPPSQAKISVF